MRKKQEDPKKSVRSTGYKVPVKGTFVAATDSSRKAFMDKYKKMLDPGFTKNVPKPIGTKKDIDPGFSIPGNKNKNIDPGFSIKKKGGMVKAKMKTGGSTSAFAKLAPPYNKATFADKIAGAKKKK
jgi:hypothetical protein